MKMYFSTAIFLSVFIIGFAYFFAGILSDNYYTELYPIVNDYFWAKTILFLVPYLAISFVGFITIYKKLRGK